VAEPERPGRLDGLDDALFASIEQEASLRFHQNLSRVIPQGRVSVTIALMHARQILESSSIRHVLIAACDSLLVGTTLAELDSNNRLLTAANSNGFVPGEAAGAVLVSRDELGESPIRCVGIGVARETATIVSDEPLRGEGLTQAVRNALHDASCAMHDVDFRITDNSGEHYYFKEAALLLSKTLRQRKEVFDIWHPADCIGEVGAAAGTAALAVAVMSARKGYSPGPSVLVHASGDSGTRAAFVLRHS